MRLISTFRPLRFVIAALFIVAPLLSASGADRGEVIWRSFLQTGDVDAALDGFRRAVDEEPDDVAALAGIAYLSECRIDGDDVMETFLDALEQGAESPEAHLFLMEAYHQAGGREDFMTLLSRVDALLGRDDLTSELRDRLVFARAQALQHLGQWDEAEAAFDELGFFTRFWTIGPFDNTEKRGHGEVYGPEESLDLGEAHEGRRRTVSWRPLSVSPYDGYIDLHAAVSPSHESTVYLAASVDSPDDRQAMLSLGYAGAVKVWVNGTLAMSIDRYHAAIPDQAVAPVKLVQGENVILIKSSAGQNGSFGLYVRLIGGDGAPLNENELAASPPDWSGATPTPGQEIADDSFIYESQTLKQMKALGENTERDPFRTLYYARLLTLLETLDENDLSVNALMGAMCKRFPGNPLLLRHLGDSERQPNRRRLAYSTVYESDPDDLAAFLGLLDYYVGSPYADKGFDLIREWDEDHDVPLSARVIEARMLRRNGLPDAAAQILLDYKDKLGAEGLMLMLECLGDSISRDEQTRILKQAIEDDAMAAEPVHTLRRIALRQNDSEEVERMLALERRLDPFSISGLVDLAANQQARGDYQASLETVARIEAIAPDDFQAHRMEAMAHRMMGDDGLALAALDRAQAILPSDPWCQEYRKLLAPDDANYASPYLRDWREIEVPESFDLSKANYVTLLHQNIVKVFPNGNSSRTVREAVKVLTDPGVSAQETRPVFYEAGTEDVIVKSARVIKPDGSVIDAPAPVKRSASNAGDAARRLYQDFMVAVLQMPSVEKGSVIELEYEIVSKKDNIYADYFGDIFYAGDTRFQPTLDSEYILLTPQSRDFYWKFIEPDYPESVDEDSAGLESEPKITEKDGQRIYHWRFTRLPTLPFEPLMPSSSEILPYVKVSTFQSWAEISEWYWNLIDEQLEPGPVVKDRLELVMQNYRASRGIDSERELTDWEKVRAVNEYVNTGIRYLGLEFGIHGYKPHKVDEICNAQYGDCKDKAALAIAMLGELGIDARMVILRTTDRGEIDYELPLLGLFNHAIYYLPDLDGQDYWIDGTATFYDASELPSGDAGANSWIIEPGGGYEFKRIRQSEAEDNGGVYTTALQIDAEGNAQGVSVSEFEGLYNPIVRRTYENAVKAKDMISQLFASQYPGSVVDGVELSDLENYADDERMSYEVAIPQFGAEQGGRLIFPTQVFKADLSRRYAQLPEREYDLVLSYPWTRENILKLSLPDGGSIETPAERSVESEFGTYTRTIDIEDREAVVRERIEVKPHRVAKEDYEEFREFCRLVDLYQDENLILNR